MTTSTRVQFNEMAGRVLADHPYEARPSKTRQGEYEWETLDSHKVFTQAQIFDAFGQANGWVYVDNFDKGGNGTEKYVKPAPKKAAPKKKPAAKKK